MANFIVTSLSDTTAADGVTTLREAIELANASAGADTITFDASLAGGLLRLTQGEMTITDSVTIDAAGQDITITGDASDNDANVAGTDLTDIDASSTGLSDNTRIFDITGASSDTTILGLTLTGGRTSGFYNAGGAIASDADLTLDGVTVYGNTTEGIFSDGGGVYSRGNITLIDSVIEGNRTSANNSEGGGVAALLSIYGRDSTIEGNATSGGGSGGGGMAAANITLVNSTVSNNATTGLNSDGGGLSTEQVATLVNSTIVDNLTAGDSSDGGGIYSQHRVVSIHSTISGNSTAGASATGGGISVAARFSGVTGGLELVNSIVSGNVNTANSGTDETFVSTTFGGITTLTGTNILGGDVYANSTATGSTSAADLFAATQEVLVDSDGDGIGDAASGVFSGVLADNGGSIETVAIRAGGAAQNTANDQVTTDDFDLDGDSVTAEALPEDALGSNRGVDLGADVGAFEISVPTILGTDNPETLNGTAIDELILGLAGNDNLNGGGGNDTLFGGDGNDNLNGQTGNDTMEGGLGNDRYFVDSFGDIVIERPGEGTDTVTTSVSIIIPENVENASTSGTSAINITGNNLNNFMVGNSASNVLAGGAGNDRLQGQGGADTLEGGAGNDILEGQAGADVLRFGVDDGNDTAFGFELGLDKLDFTQLGLRFVELSFIESAGSTRIEYDNGVGGVASVNLQGVALTDITSDVMVDPSGLGSPGGGVPLIEGDTGNNDLFGSAADEDFVGGGGNDRFFAFQGNDTMVGGFGNDRYFVTDAGDVVIEQDFQGIDQIDTTISLTLADGVENGAVSGNNAVDITGNDLNNFITGSAQTNVLLGGAGRDRLIAFGGDDTLNGGTGRDVLEGGTGADLFVFEADSDIDLITDFEVGVDLIDITALGIAYADMRIVDGALGAQVYLDLTPGSVDLITLSGVSASQLLLDSFVTVFGANQPPIVGTAGNDNLTGSQIDDELQGLGGNDLVNGAQGADTMIGGQGNDSYFVDNVGDTIIELAGEGIDVINTQVNFTLSANVENAAAAFGGGAIDLTGNGENNALTGNDAANVLNGLAGVDNLQGLAGEDEINGGTGNDILRGGDDADRFVFNTGDGADQIIDFELGIDTIDLSGTGLAFGDLTIQSVGVNATVQYGSDVITVFNVNDTQLDASQFDFV